MNTQVVISVIATLVLIGLALASVVTDADSLNGASAVPEQESHQAAISEQERANAGQKVPSN